MALKVGGTGLDLLLQKIINLGDPTAPTDATTKQYVDNLIRGLDWKQSVKAASTTNHALTGTQTVDGYAAVAGDRVLLKAQTNAAENGIWVVAAGAWSRPTDYNDSTAVTASAAVTVEQGTTNHDSVWILTTDGTITVDTTATAWSALGGGITYTAGNGILITGASIAAVAGTGGGLLVTSGGITVDRSVVPYKYAANVPSGSTSAALTHNLGTTDVIPAIYDISGAVPVLELIEAQITSANVVTLVFATAPTAGQFRAVILG